MPTSTTVIYVFAQQLGQQLFGSKNLSQKVKLTFFQKRCDESGALITHLQVTITFLAEITCRFQFGISVTTSLLFKL